MLWLLHLRARPSKPAFLSVCLCVCPSLISSPSTTGRSIAGLQAWHSYKPDHTWIHFCPIPCGHCGRLKVALGHLLVPCDSLFSTWDGGVTLRGRTGAKQNWKDFCLSFSLEHIMSNHLHSFLLLKVSLNTKGYYFEESKKKKVLHFKFSLFVHLCHC